jgi:hypothetical protein
MSKMSIMWPIAAIGCLLAGCFGYAAGSPPEKMTAIDPQVKAFLGPARLAVIACADKVETYRIDWEKKDTPIKKALAGYPIIARGNNLDPETIDMVKKIILAAASYEFQWSKRTLIRPSYALRFLSTTDVVDIVIDLESQQWAFYLKGDYVEEDISENGAYSLLSQVISDALKKSAK